jgi:hypothetical protein
MRVRALHLMLAALLLAPASAAAAGPEPGTLEYLQRDDQNVVDAWPSGPRGSSTHCGTMCPVLC